MRPLRMITAITLLLLAAPANADGIFQTLVTHGDSARLVQYETNRKSALTYARRSGDPAEYAAVKALLDLPPLAFAGFDLTGEWQCRTTKLGGNPAIVRYGWFKCMVTDDGSGWLLTKTTGSQRTTGRFYDASPTRLHYLGSFYVAGDKPKPYGKGGPESDQIGIAMRTGDASWRLEFPAPYYESKFDVMEFKR